MAFVLLERFYHGLWEKTRRDSWTRTSNGCGFSVRTVRIRRASPYVSQVFLFASLTPTSTSAPTRCRTSWGAMITAACSRRSRAKLGERRDAQVMSDGAGRLTTWGGVGAGGSCRGCRRCRRGHIHQGGGGCFDRVGEDGEYTIFKSATVALEDAPADEATNPEKYHQVRNKTDDFQNRVRC